MEESAGNVPPMSNMTEKLKSRDLPEEKKDEEIKEDGGDEIDDEVGE